MKTVFKKENLFIRIAIGFGAGILLGTLAPQFSIDAKIVGDVYLNLLKMMVIPVIICAVMTGPILARAMCRRPKGHFLVGHPHLPCSTTMW